MKYFSRVVIRSIVSIVIPFVFSFSVAHAATFSRSVATTVTVINESSVQVTQIHTVSWDDASQYFPASKNYVYAYITPAFSEQKNTVENAITNLQVKSQNGTVLQYSKSVEDGSLLLKIPYYKDLKKYQDLVFKVTFTTSLYVSSEGGILEVYYPGLPQDFKATQRNESGYTDQYAYSMVAVIPTKFGPVSATFPGTNVTKKGDTNFVNYSTNQLVGNAVRVTVGSERKIKFTLAGKTYATNSNSPDFVKDILVNYIEVALPTSSKGTEFSNQEVFYTKIEPFPVSISVDENGNVIAKLPIPATQDGTITIEGYAIIKPITLLESIKNFNIADVPSEMAKYTEEETKYWQVTASPIQEIASIEKDKSGNQFQTVRNSLLRVVKTLTYPSVVSEETLVRQGALGTLQSKQGVCMEYSDLLLSLLRAQKIPTRTVYGDGLGRRVDKTLDGIGHQWVGVWFPEMGWVPVEPTWSDEKYLLMGHDMDHFTWYVASKSVNEPLGFACQTLDSSFPCKEALRIHTESVNNFPGEESLQTLAQIQEKVEKSKVTLSPFRQALQTTVTYLGTSRFGRVILSTQGLFLLLSLVAYIVLVIIVSGIGKLLRKRKVIVSNMKKETTIPPASEIA